MSKAQVPAQVSASSYRSPVEAALSLESELEAYDRDRDRKLLLNAVREQFLLNRLIAAVSSLMIAQIQPDCRTLWNSVVDRGTELAPPSLTWILYRLFDIPISIRSARMEMYTQTGREQQQEFEDE